MQEEKHTAENASSLLTTHSRIFVFPPDQWACMNAMKTVKAHSYEGMFQFVYLGGDVDVLVMKDHADKIIPRGSLVFVVAS